MKLVLFFLSCTLAIGSQAEKPLPQTGEEYTIGMEDILSILVWREPELSVKEVMVRPDGKISLPLIGDITANGSTTKELQERLSDKFKEFVASPTVSVVVLKAVSRSVSVVGQVSRPGVYPLGAPMTVLELLARAGGLTELAREKNIKIVRKDGDKNVQFPFNYKDVIRGKSLEQNIQLKNGDVVLVP